MGEDEAENREEKITVEELEADVSAPTTTLIGRTLFKGGVLSAFGHRDFRILWPGALLSNIGTWVHMTALLWFVKELTNSDAWVGAANFANFIPVLIFVLLSGSLADRLNRKKLIIVTQVAMMLGAFALGICTSLGWASLGVIMCLTAFMGVAFVFNFPAWRAIVTDLCPGKDMLNAVVLDAAQFNMARFIGPALGAIILNVWGIAAAFYVNGFSFLAVIGALLLLKTETPGHPVPVGGTGRHIAEVLKYAWTNKWARNVLIILGVTAFFGLPFVVLLPAVAKDILGRGAAGFGLLMGFTGLGAVIAAPLVTLINRRISESEIIKGSALCAGLLLVFFSLSRTYWLSLMISIGLGASYLTMCATINTVLQSRVSRDMRGRIMSLYILVFQGVFPIGGLVMGFLADVRSAPFSLFVGGAVCFAMAVVITAFPSLLRDAVTDNVNNYAG
ncbi:MAG: MFS transporter [Actinobacteria bacterium]|nr:MFS transporter [Actinomycetota bacterium]MCG2819408.1 MFS transporter [Actinomycetes bacterium]MBU4218642.1 MFS transporter [Actinomycetota bacterium]MBU4359905.1 MFS transporter [Actinomycetota bacterium]MBU4392692.1 MFS transporter [Actinomycetota bacterium]